MRITEPDEWRPGKVRTFCQMWCNSCQVWVQWPRFRKTCPKCGSEVLGSELHFRPKPRQLELPGMPPYEG